MCLDMVKIYSPDGAFTEVPCRKCKRCKQIRLTDFAGRAYAEALTASAFYAITLTYADSASPSAQVLVYSDFQKMLKRLRFDGYKVRYIVAGEYGTKRGRAHWHCVLYFEGSAPAMPLLETQMQSWKYWPHGFVFVQKPDYRGLLYVLKYALKDDGSEKTTRRVMMSKKPPLGASYWFQLAKSRIQAGLPFSLTYTLPDATFKNGSHVQFYLSGASFHLAWAAHRSVWHSISGNKCFEPSISERDFEAFNKRFFPAELRLGLKLRHFDKIPVLGSGEFRKRVDKSIVFEDCLVSKLKTGELVFTDLRNGVTKSWRVESLAELLALVRRPIERLQRGALPEAMRLPVSPPERR